MYHHTPHFSLTLNSGCLLFYRVWAARESSTQILYHLSLHSFSLLVLVITFISSVSVAILILRFAHPYASEVPARCGNVLYFFAIILQPCTRLIICSLFYTIAVVSGGLDGMILLWDFSRGRPVNSTHLLGAAQNSAQMVPYIHT